MAIRRWNANTSTWELVGTPGTVTPASIGAAALSGNNTFAGNIGIGTSPDPISTSLTTLGGIQIGKNATATNNWHLTTEAGDGTLRFWNGNYGAGVERVRINANGTSVFGGIITGAAPSSSKLYINNGSNENIGNPTWGGSLVINEYSNTLNANMGIEFKTRADNNGSGWRISSLANNPDFVFESRSSSATWTERMRIDSDGNMSFRTVNSTSSVRKISRVDDNLTTDLANVSMFGAGANNFNGVIAFNVKSGGFFNSPLIEAMRIGPGGGVAIGSTNTTTHKLYIEDSGTIDTLRTWNTNQNFTAHIYQALANRGQTSAYFFYSAFSSGGGDAEFWVRGDGQVAADSSYTSNGADYAEYFEWADGNPHNEDRVGLTVSLVNDKIKIAEEGESPVGVISGSPSVVGDNAFNSWSGKYLKDDFGRHLLDENGDRILNPEYNPELEYVSREDRPEWAIVGLMGKLRLRKGQITGAGWIKMKDISSEVEEWLVK